MNRRPAILILTLALLAGCINHPTPPAAVSIVANADLKMYAPLWQAEARKRFDNPLVFMAHGGVESATGRWIYRPDSGPVMPVEGMVIFLRSMYPDRDLVLVVCNPGSISIKPRAKVWYCRRSIYACPDSFCLLPRPNDTDGDISDFRQ